MRLGSFAWPPAALTRSVAAVRSSTRNDSWTCGSESSLAEMMPTGGLIASDRQAPG